MRDIQMSPGKIRHRARSQYAFTDAVGTLSRDEQGSLHFRLNYADIRQVIPLPGVEVPEDLSGRFRAVLWPRSGDDARPRWVIASLAPTTDKPRRTSTYISATVVKVTGATLGLRMTFKDGSRSDLSVWATSEHFPERPGPGARVLIHAHMSEGVLRAHHIIEVPRAVRSGGDGHPRPGRRSPDGGVAATDHNALSQAHQSGGFL